MIRIIHCYNNEEGTYVMCIDEACNRTQRIPQEVWFALQEKYGDALLEDPFSILDEAAVSVEDIE